MVYTSHMLEHLDRKEAQRFLAEARRVLAPGGIIRVAVPDLALLVRSYTVSGDADTFISGMHIAQDRPTGPARRIKAALTGPRNHLWMYDGQSLADLLRRAGFSNVCTMPAGSTRIPDPAGLDLSERAEESIYVEARNPGL
jgi:SAM-dependent methyltransferase